jgi:hypothetical protein
MTSDPAKQAWKASVETAGAPPLEQVRKGAAKLYRRVWRRNAVEYAACVVVVGGMVPVLLTSHDIVRQIGAALTVAGVAFVAWQLRSRASADHPDLAGAMPILQFARAQLVRQRDALGGVLWWYMLPLVPGMLVTWLANLLDRLKDGRWTVASGLLALGFMALILVGVWWLNQRGARKLQKHIDEIDALIGGVE